MIFSINKQMNEIIKYEIKPLGELEENQAILNFESTSISNSFPLIHLSNGEKSWTSSLKLFHFF